MMEPSENPHACIGLRLGPRVAGQPIPLTPIQYGLFNERQQQGPTNARMCAAAARISGSLDVAALRSSLDYIVCRHESLRTRVIVVNGNPQQVVDPAGENCLTIVDLRELPTSQLEAAAARRARDFVDERIELSVGPLFEARVLRLAEREHVLLLLIDHIVTDAVSCEILNSELWTVYRQVLRGEPLSLPPLAVQFADYAIWLDRSYERWLRQHGAYWRHRMADVSSAPIPIDQGLPQTKHLAAATQHFPLGKVLSVRIRELAAREAVRLPLVMLALHAVVMSRWCNQTDLVIALISHGRHGRKELGGMIGYLAYQLHLRVQLGAVDSFLDLLQHVAQEFEAACRHQDYGYLPRFLPSCATELRFNWVSSRVLKFANRSAEVDDVFRMRPYPVQFAWPVRFMPFFYDSPAGIGATVHYRTDLRRPETIKWYGTSLRFVAERLMDQAREGVISISSQLQAPPIAE
jgi:hypothetical protein